MKDTYVFEYVNENEFRKLERALKKYWAKVKEINALEDKIAKLSDEELKHKTVEFREFLKKNGKEEYGV